MMFYAGPSIRINVDLVFQYVIDVDCEVMGDNYSQKKFESAMIHLLIFGKRAFNYADV